VRPFPATRHFGICPNLDHETTRIGADLEANIAPFWIICEAGAKLYTVNVRNSTRERQP
jgi:hypothetical protein